MDEKTGNYKQFNKNVDNLINEYFTSKFYHDSFNQIVNISNKKVFKFARFKVVSFIQNDGPNSVCSTFQQLYLQNRNLWLNSNKFIIENGLSLNFSYDVLTLGEIGKKIINVITPLNENLNSWQKYQSLTKREKEILKLLAEGSTSKIIGNMLSISENTLRTHRENIRKKIDANSLYEMIKFAESFDLIGAL
jgi:DNA-binding CsgD family transcriptional regulator